MIRGNVDHRDNNEISSFVDKRNKQKIISNQHHTNMNEPNISIKRIISTAMFLWPLISSLLFSNAQYHQYQPHNPSYLSPLSSSSSSLPYTIGTCDSGRLVRCQQDIARDMQVVVGGLNSMGAAAALQYPISGPPYAASAKLQQAGSASGGVVGQVTATTCRLVRSNLDCLMSTTPNCYEAGVQAAQSQTNEALILRSKRFLEQYNCNEPDITWQTTFCYRAAELRSCEERYDFTGASSARYPINATSCLAYQAFKYCVESHLRLNCKVHEIDMVNEYLIDRAGELSWRCPINQTAASVTLNYGSHSNPYALNNNNPAGTLLSPSAYGNSLANNYASGYEPQRPVYVGSNAGGGGNLFTGTVRDQAWERFRTPVDETRYGISRHPGLIGASGTGEVFDRLVAANAAFDMESSDCPIKAAPYARECEDNLIEQQRLARDSRDGNELQRRTCCSLFQYRDCISRVVLDRCADSSPAAVEILMGIRRREMAITCRGFNRDLCSGALASVMSNPMVLLLASLLATFISFKQQQQLSSSSLAVS